MFGSHKKSRKESGFASLGVHPDGVSIVMAQCTPDAIPCITAWEFRPWHEGETLEDVLSCLAKEYKLGRQRCVTLLEPSDYRLLVAEAPDVPPADLPDAMRWRIKDLLDFDVSKATVDVFDFPAAGVAGESRQRYVVAAQNQALQQRICLMEAAGINLDIVDIPEMALRNMAALVPESQHGVAFLSLSPSSGLLTLTKGNTLYMSRNLNVGIDELVNASQRGEYLDNIVEEIQRSLDYYVSHFRQSPITQLILAPFPERLPNMDEFFSRRIGLSVVVVEIKTLVDVQCELPDDAMLKGFTTLGAAIRQVG